MYAVKMQHLLPTCQKFVPFVKMQIKSLELYSFHDFSLAHECTYASKQKFITNRCIRRHNYEQIRMFVLSTQNGKSSTFQTYPGSTKTNFFTEKDSRNRSKYGWPYHHVLPINCAHRWEKCLSSSLISE